MPQRVPILAPVAGAAALAVSVVAFAVTAGGEVHGSPATLMTILLGVGGGVVALLRPDRIWALAFADALVATAAAVSMFGLGMLELLPLVLLGAATVRTPHRSVVPAAAPAAALGFEERQPVPELRRRSA
jgi:hypothetical protein